MLEKTDLHEYQLESITELYERENVLGVVPMGGGKTVSALTAFQELQAYNEVRNGIVLAPKRVAHSVWRQEVREWAHLQDLKVMLVSGTPAQRVKLLNTAADMHIVGIDNTKWLADQIDTWETDDPRLDLLCIDEISRYKKPNGKRSRALSLVADRFKNRWGLTGTPMPNNELDLYQPARILIRRTIWPEQFDQWKMQYFIPDNPITQFHWDIREEWREKIWTDIGQFSFTIDQNRLPPQPELQATYHTFDLPTAVQRLYDDMLRHLVIDVNGEIVEAENTGVAYGKLDQLAQGFIYRDGETLEIVHREKTRILKDLIDGVGGQQVMITYWFKEDLVLLKELYPDLAVLGSETKDARADEIVEQWNAGEITLMAVHPASAGHGLNLQKSHAGQIIHFCLPWSAELYDQVVRRIARQGNEQARVFNHFIMANNTLDTLKCERVIEKMERQDAFKAFVASRLT